MQRLKFINPMAQITEVRVAAVNDNQPLKLNEIYIVSDGLADDLLKNEDDWRLMAPPKDDAKLDETTEMASVVARGGKP